jgi:uncharacterized membrane protein YbhN (UPF0104 family)
MSMAGKYIPGKVLFMVGRIQAYGPNKKRLGIASFGMVVEFIVEIMAGALLLLLAGAFGVLPDYATPWLICAGCLFISGAMSNLFFERSFKAKAITKRYGTLPKLNNGLLNHLPLLLTMGHWAVYLGSIAILHPQIHLNLLQWLAVGAALGFSSTIGTLSLITPGGLGVREGLATVLFTHLGLEPQMAFQLAIGARITQWIAELSCAVPVVLWELWLSQKRKTQSA